MEDIIASLIKFNAKGWDRSKVHELWHEYLYVDVVWKITGGSRVVAEMKSR